MIVGSELIKHFLGKGNVRCLTFNQKLRLSTVIDQYVKPLGQILIANLFFNRNSGCRIAQFPGQSVERELADFLFRCYVDIPLAKRVKNLKPVFINTRSYSDFFPVKLHRTMIRIPSRMKFQA